MAIPMECYICLESGDNLNLLTNICACKNTYVHTACLTRWIDETKSTDCSICKDPFKGVQVVYKPEPGALRRKRTFIGLAIASFTGVVLSTVQLAMGIFARSRGMADILFVAFLGVMEVWWFLNILSRAAEPHTHHHRVIEVSSLDDYALRV